MTQPAHVLDSATLQAFARLEQAAHDAANSNSRESANH